MRAISLTKTYKCDICKQPFKKDRLMQKICSRTECIVEQVYKNKEKREKVERKETKEKLLAIKPRSKYMQEAQTAVNAWIRARDEGLPCISCQRHHQGQYHAGHFRSVGACPELRFEPDNIHKQCSPCNNHLSGNIVAYRPRLIDKIGLERVEWIEGKHDAKKYTIDDLKEIAKIYKAKLKHLKAFNDMVKLTEEMGLYDKT